MIQVIPAKLDNTILMSQGKVEVRTGKQNARKGVRGRFDKRAMEAEES